MTMRDIASSVERVRSTLRAQPDAGLHEDTPATAQWERGLRIVSRHPLGMEMSTDMPRALGGTGEHVTPGWLFRAGVASCAASCIVMAAATEGLELDALEVVANSRSDTRGLLGIAAEDGAAVVAAPLEVRLEVRIAARGATEAQLRELVEQACARSPVPGTVRAAVPLELRVTIAS